MPSGLVLTKSDSMILVAPVLPWGGVLLYSYPCCLPELSVREAAMLPFGVPNRFMSKTQGVGKLWELVMDREAWRAAVHGVTNSRTRLCN